ncbi:MAG: CZB domain-containing protein [Magnetococcales bacterium]|nr:CZB domain-containing protein [Magnetococcales bacterium]
MIDLSVARLVHIKWVIELEEALKKGRIPTLTTHSKCELGRWIYEHGLDRYKEYPEIRQLELKHHRFHDMTAEAVRYYKNHDEVKAFLVMEEIHKLSRDLVYLLTVVEYKILHRSTVDELLRHPVKTLRKMISRS